jgi:methyl-accepting chemotaxis protein
MRITWESSLKQKVFGLIGFLSLLPIACFGLTIFSMLQSNKAGQAVEAANKGALHIAHLNGMVYAVVMDSRGIYMSPDWKTAEPFGSGLLQHLAELKKIMAAWRLMVIEAERAKVETLAASLDQFIQFRTELVRLAREESTAAARTFGDNDTNRKSRSDLNARLVDLEKDYMALEDQAQGFVASLKSLNFNLLVGIAVMAILTGALGTFFVYRTVIMLVNRMRLVMMELAAGNLDARFEGAHRKDEIGDFARAFESFKQAAIDKLRVEAEAKEERDKSQAERAAAEAQQREAEAEKAKAAAEQARSLDALADGLARLAEGDLTISIADEFTEA